MGKIQKESDTSFNIHAGKRLRKARIELGKTQSWVGEQIKVTFQQVQKYEKGTNGMSGATLGRLAIALNVKVTYFYEGYDIVKGVSSFSYKDNPPELHRGNQVKNEAMYPDPQQTPLLNGTNIKIGY
jgi:transcriptional regulator with XRE-family HTH domain